MAISQFDAEWREMLTEEQFQVTRKHATEPAFTGALWDEKKDGTYACICCGEILFSSETKYDSGSGWLVFMSRWMMRKSGQNRSVFLHGKNRSALQSVKRI